MWNVDFTIGGVKVFFSACQKYLLTFFSGKNMCRWNLHVMNPTLKSVEFTITPVPNP